jgi:hypothetical protein
VFAASGFCAIAMRFKDEDGMVFAFPFCLVQNFADGVIFWKQEGSLDG